MDIVFSWWRLFGLWLLPPGFGNRLEGQELAVRCTERGQKRPAGELCRQATEVLMPKPEPVTLEYVRSFAQTARKAFAFLEGSGFRLTAYGEPNSTDFRDGWHLRYGSASLALSIDYYDMELSITFSTGDTSATYRFIDQHLFANASGYAGNMFPLDTLDRAIATIAADIRLHYADVLAGEPATWETIQRLGMAPTAKPRLP
jgi:hypothetical protein